MVKVKEIAHFLDAELDIYGIEDSSCNGLQVENEKEITKIGFAVDACKESFEKAVQQGCQMLITHHGLIWEGIKYIKGVTYQKVSFLIKNDLALYAAHLPLDLHNKYGNNIKLAEILGLQDLKAFGYHKGKAIGFIGEVQTTLEEIKKVLSENGMKTTSFENGPQEIKKIAIVSGGAKYDAIQAINAGADLYFTGEVAYLFHHLAKENKINIICGGHYNTEVWGVKALMPVLKEKFNVETEFIDVPIEI